MSISQADQHRANGTSKSRTHFLKAALAYAAADRRVFPCKPGGKEPLTRRGHLDATTDPRRITAWWRRWPDANIATPTGRGSGLTLDVDHPASLDALEAEHGKLPPTRTHSTGSGGMHLIFRYPDGVEIRNSARKLGFGLDVRGEGGYMIVPPSRTTRPYEVLDALPLAEPPAWLVEALTEAQRARSGGAGRASRGYSISAALDGPPIAEGTRDNTLASIAGVLHDGSRDLDQLTAELVEINARRCEPPLPERQVEKIARSIHRREPCKQSSRTTPVVREIVHELRRAVEDHGWSGVADHSTRDVYLVLLDCGDEHGTEIGPGVRVSISVREIAERAAIGSTLTVWRCINRLRRRGLVRRDGTGRGPQSGAIVLLCGPRAQVNTLTTGGAGEEREEASVYFRASAPRLRWSAPGHGGRLGKIRGRIIDLLESRGPLTVEELADELAHKRPWDLRRRTLAPLVAAGVVECVSGEYRLTAGWRQVLDKRREEDGEIEAARWQRKQHEDQRERFREAWRRGDVVSKGEFARRRRNRARIRPEERHVSGTVEELEPIEKADPELVEALVAFLDRNPHRRDESPSWLSVALWAHEYLPEKPDKAAVELALVELRAKLVAA